MSGWNYVDIEELVASGKSLYLSGGDAEFDATIGGKDLRVTLSGVVGMIYFRERDVLPADPA